MGPKLMQGLKIQDGRHTVQYPMFWLTQGSRILILSEAGLIRKGNPSMKYCSVTVTLLTDPTRWAILDIEPWSMMCFASLT